jgi:hypothetical protein
MCENCSQKSRAITATIAEEEEEEEEEMRE